MRILKQAIISVVIVGFCVASSIWAIVNLDQSWNAARIRNVTSRIMMGEEFKSEVLSSLEPELAAVSAHVFPEPDLIRALAIIRVRQVELEVSAGRSLEGNQAVAQAEIALKRALALTPTDSFLWFSLCWLTKARDGISERVVFLLRLSYKTGQHEGWVAVHRNALAVTMMPSLPSDLQDTIVSEFRNLVESHYTGAAAQTLAGSGWFYRDRFLSALEDVPVEQKLQLVRAVADLGLDIVVPGVTHQGSRPWQ